MTTQTYHKTRQAAERKASTVPGAYVICATKGTCEYAVVYPKEQEGPIGN